MRKRLILAGLTLLMILIAWAITAGLGAQLHKSHIRHTADSFVSNVLAGKYDQSYAQFSDQAKRKQSSADWTSTTVAISRYFQGARPEYNDTLLTGNTAVITYNVTAHNAHYLFTVKLVQAQKQWQVDAFTSKLQV